MKGSKEYQRLRKKLLKQGNACRACHVTPATEPHHKMGRGILVAEEKYIIMICGECHDWIHDNPQAAYAAGLLLSRHDRPTKTETQ